MVTFVKIEMNQAVVKTDISLHNLVVFSHEFFLNQVKKITAVKLSIFVEENVFCPCFRNRKDGNLVSST